MHKELPGTEMKAEISWMPCSLFSSSFEEDRGLQQLTEQFLFALGSAKVQNLKVQDILKSWWEQQKHSECRITAGFRRRCNAEAIVKKAGFPNEPGEGGMQVRACNNSENELTAISLVCKSENSTAFLKAACFLVSKKSTFDVTN